MTGGKYALRRAALAARPARCAPGDPPQVSPTPARCAARSVDMVGGKYHLARMLAERERAS